MKKTLEIIGLPVVDLSTGNQLGTVYDLVINAEKGSADYFIVDDGFILLGAKVIDARDVKGIGEYALTVEKKEAVKDIIMVDSAVNLYKKKIKVKSTKVLTQKGKLIGETGEIYISENDCLISAVEFYPYDNKAKARIIPRKGIVTFGENLVVVVDKINEIQDAELSKEYTEIGVIQGKLPKQVEVKDEEISYKEQVETKSVDITRAPAKQQETKSAPKKELVDKKVTAPAAENTDDYSISPKTKIAKQEEPVEEKQILKDEAAEAVNTVFEEGLSAKNVYYRPGVKQYEIHKKQAAENLKKEQPKSSELFEIKQREYLLGRKATKEIHDKMGNNILSTGELITEETMNKAKESGKFIELVMNNRP